MRLYVASIYAADFTQVALATGFALTSGVALVTSYGTDVGNPTNFLIYLAFVSGSPLWIGLAIAIYVVFLVFFKKNKEKVIAWVEKEAINPGKYCS